MNAITTINKHELRLKRGEEHGTLFCFIGGTENSITIAHHGVPRYCCLCGTALIQDENITVF